MSNFFKQQTIKKTRKEHQCYFCLDIIPKGTEAQSNRGVWEGDFFHNYVCPICVAFNRVNPGRGDEGYEEGEFKYEQRYQDFKAGWKACLNIENTKSSVSQQESNPFSSIQKTLSSALQEVGSLWLSQGSVESSITPP